MLSKQVTQQTTMIQDIHKLHTAQGNSIMNAIQQLSNRQPTSACHVPTYNANENTMQTYANSAQKRGLNSITSHTHEEPTLQKL